MKNDNYEVFKAFYFLGTLWKKKYNDSNEQVMLFDRSLDF